MGTTRKKTGRSHLRWVRAQRSCMILLCAWMQLVHCYVAAAEDGGGSASNKKSAAAEVDLEKALTHSVQVIQANYQLGKVWLVVSDRRGRTHEVDVNGALPSDGVMVGSLTKMVTGLAVARLIQDGKLTLSTRLGEVLTKYFDEHGKPLDPSLRDITVERLLTHTAGLRTNYLSDPVHGIRNSDVFSNLGPDSTAFDYLVAAHADVSNGRTDYVYSNISYLLLGLVVEAISGESYQQFCIRNVFAPLGILDALIPDSYQVVAPFAGWRMKASDMLKLVVALDAEQPAFLTRETLHLTLLGELGPALGRGKDVHYTLGVYVKQNSSRTGYLVSHNGVANFFKDEPTYFAFLEAAFPGAKYSLFISPAPSAGEREKVITEMRHGVNESLGN